ncbi:MAG: hypothetical protein U0Y10_27330 [Spirosomataceae bacterium]
MRNFENNTLSLFRLLAISILLMLCYLIFTSFHTNKTDLTIDPINSLAQIISIIISSLNLIIFLKLTVKINQYTIDKDRPVLIFELDKVEGQHGYRWFIKNVGSGPALNILVGYSQTLSIDVEQYVKLYSLSSNSRVEVSFNAPAYFLAYYKDIFQDTYQSKCENDTTNFEKLNSNEKYEDAFLKSIRLPDLPPISKPYLTTSTTTRQPGFNDNV